jgi:hypothetical protein
MTVGRLSQAAVEVLLQPVLHARLTEQTGEVVLQPVPRARLTGQAIEALRSVSNGASTSARRPVMIVCVLA